MELAIVGGLAGLGYFLGSQPDQERSAVVHGTQMSPKEIATERAGFRPSSNNVYSSTRYTQTRAAEQALADDLYKKAETPWSTGIVPPFMNSEPNAMTPPAVVPSDASPMPKVISSTLVEPFSHSNMVPFFGSTVKQNMDPYQNQTLLANYTGTDDLIPRKTEAGPMFKPVRNDFVNGLYEKDRDLSRYIPSITQEGVKPFQPVQVGPGLNQGPTSVGTGGFQDLYRAPEKTVDDLRVKPKVTYQGRVLPPKAVNDSRGQIGQVAKNQPETSWLQTVANWLKTTGAVMGNTQRPEEIVKPTNRMNSRSVQGAVAPATHEGPEGRPRVKKDTRQTFTTDGPRNAGMSDGWSVQGTGDISGYGKDGVANRDNERTLTGCRTYTSNVRADVDRETAQTDDKARVTRKQGFVTYSRQGAVKVKGIGEFPVEDKTPLKTTTKETLIHDASIGSYGNTGPSKRTVYDENDIARRTTKETLIHDARNGNVDAPKKSAGNSYDPDEWRMRSTVREKEPNKWGSNPNQPVLTGQVHQQEYLLAPARRTTKETTIDNEYEGQTSGPLKPTVYDPKDTPRATIKDTTIDDNRLGGVNSTVLQEGDAYQVTEYDARPTNRQFSNDVEYFGDASVSEGKAYLTNPVDMKTTMRESESDNMAIGPALDTNAKSQTSHLQYCNAEFNSLKEKVLKGRSPTQTSTKVAAGGDAMNVESKHLLPEEDTRDFAVQRNVQIPGMLLECSDTRGENKTSEVPDDRIDVALLQAYRSNPYTHSFTDPGGVF